MAKKVSASLLNLRAKDQPPLDQDLKPAAKAISAYADAPVPWDVGVARKKNLKSLEKIFGDRNLANLHFQFLTFIESFTEAIDDDRLILSDIYAEFIFRFRNELQELFEGRESGFDSGEQTTLASSSMAYHARLSDGSIISVENGAHIILPSTVDFIALKISAGLGLDPSNIEYQVRLAGSHEKPWTKSGAFCGSDVTVGSPIIGLRVRLLQDAVFKQKCSYSGVFQDGTEANVEDNQWLCSPSGAPFTELKVSFTPRTTEAIETNVQRTDHFPPLNTRLSWTTDRFPGEAPPAFIKRAYSDVLGSGFARADLQRTDPSLYRALAAWLKDNDMPLDLDLPTPSERVERIIAQIEARAERDPLLRLLSDSKTLNSLSRAMERRGK